MTSHQLFLIVIKEALLLPFVFAAAKYFSPTVNSHVKLKFDNLLLSQQTGMFSGRI